VSIGAGESDGRGLAWSPDGKILSSDDKSQFWLSSPDGRNRFAAYRIEGDIFPGAFSLCGGGHSLILNLAKVQHTTIWRADSSGSGLAQLTAGPRDLFPECSPDGNWVIYIGVGKENKLMRIPTAGGSPETASEEKNVLLGRYSPDGNQIGILFQDGEGGAPVKIAILDPQGHIIRKFDLPPGQLPWDGPSWVFRWTPGGQGFVIGMEAADVANLWYQPISGGKPQQLTHFTNSVINVAWSADEKRIALTRRVTTADAVLFSDFR